jgi:hypothetical protein
LLEGVDVGEVTAVVAVCTRFRDETAGAPMFKIPPGPVGAGAREPLSVVDVELSLSQQHCGAHIDDVSNRVETC